MMIMMATKWFLLLFAEKKCSMSFAAAFVSSSASCSSILVHSTGLIVTPFFSSSPARVHSQQNSRLFESRPQTRMERQEEAYLQLSTTTTTATTSTRSNSNNNKNPDVVYIIMYHPGSREEEGVHTTEFPKESGQEVLLAFESLDEINKFANVLRDDPTCTLDPVPTPAPLANLQVACQQMGLVMKLVPA